MVRAMPFLKERLVTVGEVVELDTIEVKLEQPANALSSILVTLLGIIAETRFIQPANAPTPILVTQSVIIAGVIPSFEMTYPSMVVFANAGHPIPFTAFPSNAGGNCLPDAVYKIATFVSPFLGRLDDVGTRGMELIEEIVDIFAIQEISTEVIAASIRNPIHVTRAARCGCHIATVPANVMWQMLSHPLTEIGIEKFLKDWEGFVGS